MSDQRRSFDPWNEEDYAALPTEPVHQVIPYLLQADAHFEPDEAWRHDVRVLVNVAGWMRDVVKVPFGCVYLAWHFDDDPQTLPDTSILRHLAALLADRVRREEKVVVHCAGGLNRSGLVVAQTLIELGHRPADAIELVRGARGKWALSNPAFEAFLLSQS